MLKVFSYSTSTILVRCSFVYAWILLICEATTTTKPISDHGSWPLLNAVKMNFHCISTNYASDWITIRIHFKKPILNSTFVGSNDALQITNVTEYLNAISEKVKRQRAKCKHRPINNEPNAIKFSSANTFMHKHYKKNASN